MSKLYTVTIFILALAMCQLPIHAEPQAEEPGRHLFILSGQSNMRKPLPNAFWEAVSEVFGKDKVLVVTAAWPSQPIRNWYKNWTPPEGMEPGDLSKNGQLYDRLINLVERKVGDKKIDSVTYVWMQGEADADKGWGAVYEQSFLGVLEQIKQDLKVEDVNFVIGRINDYWTDEEQFPDGDLVRSVQQKLGEEHDNGAWVNTDDLNTGLNPWGLYELQGGHFPNSGYLVLGQRMAKEACLLIDPDIEISPTTFNAVHMDRSDDVKTHAAIDKTITGTKPASDKALTMLLDGKFGSPQNLEENWVIFGPEETEVSLLIDLGETIELDALGFSFLVDAPSNATFPVSVKLSTSADGEAYQIVKKRKDEIQFAYKPATRAQWNASSKQRNLLLYIQTAPRPARYVKMEFKKDDALLVLDEVMVNLMPKP